MKIKDSIWTQQLKSSRSWHETQSVLVWDELTKIHSNNAKNSCKKAKAEKVRNKSEKLIKKNFEKNFFSQNSYNFSQKKIENSI